LHIIFDALLFFVEENGELPRLNDEEDAEILFEIA